MFSWLLVVKFSTGAEGEWLSSKLCRDWEAEVPWPESSFSEDFLWLTAFCWEGGVGM